jgi:RNA polymerase sigma factor (sigma-70 family)
VKKTEPLAENAMEARFARCFREGDVAAWEEFIDRNSQSLHRKLFAMLRDREEARDCAQAAFERLWMQRRRIDNPRAWLFRVASNIALNLIRARTTRDAKQPLLQVWHEAHTSGGPSVTAEMPDRSRIGWFIHSAASPFTSHERKLLWLVAIGETWPAIAAEFNQPESTLRSRYNQLLERLRDELRIKKVARK